MRVSIYCPRCHRHTSVDTALTEVEVSYTKTDVPLSWKRSENEVWWMGACNYCRQTMLVLNEGQQIYPTPLPDPTDHRVPEHIRRDLDEAKACLQVGASRAATVMARRALQTACIDRGAPTGRDLIEQIGALMAKGEITKKLKELAHTVRWVGNDAAHPNKSEVLPDDAEEIIILTEDFLTNLYVTPARVVELRKKRRSGNQEES